jgi:SAM-dependent methyltransferase
MVDTEAVAPAFLVRAEPWIAFRPALDAMLGPLGDAALTAVHVGPGDRVLDVGCGCGTTTADLALRAGPQGAVTGIDTDAAVITEARATVAGGAGGSAGSAPVDFVVGDAATHPFPPEAHDVVYSRFGLMFFADPEPAFANLRRTLARDGRLGFVSWRPLEDNPWIVEARAAAEAIVPLPPLEPVDAPGPFSLGDPDRISTLLTGAGFVDVEIAAHDRPILIGRGDPDEAVACYLRLLPADSLLFETDRHLLDRLRAALRILVDRYVADDGIWMGAATWVVRAS